VRRFAILPTVLLALAAPSAAQTSTGEVYPGTPPFGSWRWPDAEGAEEPVLIDIEIEHEGSNFWRGQLDGRSDSIKLTSGWGMHDDCDIIIINSGSSPEYPTALEFSGPPELRIEIRPYISRTPEPVRFILAFTYEASIRGSGPSGPSCSHDVDRRTAEMNFEFEIEPGQTIILPDYLGYTIRLTRP
jgi:hypothetical protein